MQSPGVNKPHLGHLLALFVLLAVSLDTWQTAVQALDTKKDYDIEMFLVLDHYAFNGIYMKENNNDRNKAETSAKEDIDYYITEINKHFASLKPLKMKIRIKEHIIMDEATPLYSSCSHFLASSDYALGLNCFSKWLTDGGYGSDLSMLWTGINLNAGYAGFAKQGGVCAAGGAATSIVEYTGSYVTAITSSHEIGHNLQMTHDGKDEKWIMAETNGGDANFHTNRWLFSNSTRDQAIAKIETLSPSGGCLLETSPDSDLPDVRDPPQAMADPNTVCQRAVGRQAGSESYLIHKKNVPPGGDAICTSIECASPGQGAGQSQSVIPTEGMVCGSGKRCHRTGCVNDSRFANEKLDDTCLYGDMRKWLASGTGSGDPPKSCYFHLEDAGAPLICGNPESGTPGFCCRTCANLRDTSQSVCPWGEHTLTGGDGKQETCQEAFASSTKQAICSDQTKRLSCLCSCNSTTQVDPCIGMTCNHNGTCAGGKCTCNPGYSGTYCLPHENLGPDDPDEEDDDDFFTTEVIAAIAIPVFCVLMGCAVVALCTIWRRTIKENPYNEEDVEEKEKQEAESRKSNSSGVIDHWVSEDMKSESSGGSSTPSVVRGTCVDDTSTGPHKVPPPSASQKEGAQAAPHKDGVQAAPQNKNTQVAPQNKNTPAAPQNKAPAETSQNKASPMAPQIKSSHLSASQNKDPAKASPSKASAAPSPNKDSAKAPQVKGSHLSASQNKDSAKTSKSKTSTAPSQKKDSPNTSKSKASAVPPHHNKDSPKASKSKASAAPSQNKDFAPASHNKAFATASQSKLSASAYEKKITSSASLNHAHSAAQVTVSAKEAQTSTLNFGQLLQASDACMKCSPSKSGASISSFKSTEED